MTNHRWMEQVEKALGNIAVLGHKHPWLALGFATILSATGLYLSRDLSLNPDLVDLLPKTFRSVTDIEKLKDRFGGIGYVVVVGMDAEPEALKRFADDLSPQLETLPGIRFVEYQRPWRFFEDHALYYLNLDDLNEIESRINARIDWERQERNPMFVRLDEEDPPSLDFSDIENRYAGKISNRLVGNSQDYYLDPDKQIVALLCKPKGAAIDLGFSKTLFAEIEQLIKKQDLKKYGPNFKVGYTGTYRKKLDQQVQISADLKTASAVAFFLLLGYLIFHFRSFWALAMVLIPVTVGLTWTYGFVGIRYGQVNILTAFLGAILGGLGTEHGIHLLGRYEGLSRDGASSEAATRQAFSHTGVSALISAAVAALTFLSLRISEFRAFREFGVIAAAGMILTMLAYFPVVPAILSLRSRWGFSPKASDVKTVTGFGSELVGILPKTHRIVALVLGLISLGLILNVHNIKFDYDFAALEDSQLPSYVLDRHVNKLLGYSQTPVIVLTDTQAEEAAVTKEINSRISAKAGASTIDFVASISDLVPESQTAKQEVLAKIATALDKVGSNKLEPDMRQSLERAQRMTRALPFTQADVPSSVRRQFQGVGSHESNFVLVFPNISLADGAKVRLFAQEVRDLVLPNGKTVSAAGDAMVLADILEMVTREAPPVLLAALLSVLLAMWLTLGKLRTALVCLFPTVVSILALVGLMPIVGLSFNYLNIVVIPVLIGTTVDAGVHMVTRFKESGGDFVSVYGETGRAICGGLLTSAVGFGALLLADHPGLNSLGILTNLGFATNLVAMLLGFPSLLLIVESRRAEKK